jgi:hypothetical protein
MSSFHFCLSTAKNRSSFQLLPTSLVTDLLQLDLGLSVVLLPWGFYRRAASGTSPSSFLNVWPIHLNFLFLISKFISPWPVTLHKSLLEIIFGHHILRIYLRHRFTKVYVEFHLWQAMFHIRTKVLILHRHWKLSINRFNDNFSSYMHKFLFWVKICVL